MKSKTFTEARAKLAEMIDRWRINTLIQSPLARLKRSMLNLDEVRGLQPPALFPQRIQI